MKPIDDFYYCQQNYLTPDIASLMRLYYPLMQASDLALYLYFVAFFDNGAVAHKFTEILNHTQFGMGQFEESLARLTALDLVAFFQTDKHYMVQLKQPLDADSFLSNAVLAKLLEQKIGEVALQHLTLENRQAAKDLSKKFSDLFGGDNLPQKRQRTSQKITFDSHHFKKRMASTGLQFADEATDILGLNQMAEEFQLSWYDTFLLAQETAHHGKISLQRMKAKQQATATKVDGEVFSKEEASLLQAAKSAKPEVFLARVKRSRKARITADERLLLDQLIDMGFLDEVINVMMMYAMIKTKSANVKKSYLMKIANDFSYQKVTSAEIAIMKMRSFDQRKARTNTVKPAKTNVPTWSNESYKNETSAEEQARLDEIKRQTLARLRKDGE